MRGILTWAFMIMNGFPESHPEIQHTQSARESAYESTGNNPAQLWGGQQQRIVGPLWGPWQDQKKHTKSGTQGHK